MQHARSMDDGKIWEASKFSQLPPGEIELKRRNLVCAECGEFAWYRKESAHGHPAHFCAHHIESCSLKVQYTVIDEPRNNATDLVDEVANGDGIIVRLDEEVGGEVDVNQVQPAPGPEQGGGGTRFVGVGTSRESNQHFTLRRILFRLVQSPAFRESDKHVAFYRNAENLLVEGQVRNVIVEFSEISRGVHHDKILLYWGPIASARKTADGKLWLNSSDRHQGASVAVFEDIVAKFLLLFKIKDLEDEIAGSHVLVAGRCTYSQSTGKPVIWCASPTYIFLRRYRDEQFQAAL